MKGAPMLHFIIPPVSDCFMPTLGVCQIAGYLKENHISCKVYDASAELLNIIFGLRKEQPEFILKSLDDNFYTYRNIVSLLKIFSEKHKGFKITTDDFQVGFRWQEIDELQKYIEQEQVFSAELEKLPCVGEMAGIHKGYYGFSVSYESQVIPTLLLAKIMKKKNPMAKICVGGSLLYNYENDFYKWLYLFDLVDILIVGAGEEVWKYIGLDKWETLVCLPGIHVRNIQGKYIIDTREMEYRQAVYSPDFSDIDFALYPTKEKAFPYMIMDKCYYGKCYFCNGDKVESQSIKKNIELAFAKIQEMANHIGIYNVYITDAALSPIDLKRISELSMDVPVKWIANGRFEKGLKDEKLISQIAQNGCVMLRFGLESASQKVLELMNKGTQVSDAEEILRLTARYGIKNHVYIMFGYPGETEWDREQTIHFLERNHSFIFSYSVSVFQPIPGTFIYKQLEKKLGNDEKNYERMLALIYGDEYEYEKLKMDIVRLNRILYGYVETNMEYYSANIFNQYSNKSDKNLKDRLINKEELIKFGLKEADLENHIWIIQKGKKTEKEKYIMIDLYESIMVHLAVSLELIDKYRNNSGEDMDGVLKKDKMTEEFERILNQCMYIKENELADELQYFDVYWQMRNENREISIQFSPENKLW